VFAEDDGIGRHISGNYTVRTDDAIIADSNTLQDGDIAVDLYVFADDNRRGVEFRFVPDVFWLGIESVVVVIKFATFRNTGIIAQFYFIQTIDGNIMAEIHIISENQRATIPDSDRVMISPNHVFPNLKFGIVIQFKSSGFPDPQIRMKMNAGMRIENTVRIKFLNFCNRFWNDIQCFVN